MSSISLRHIYKVYPKKEKQKFKLFRKKNENSNDEEVLAVDDFNMEIEDGEFVVFVGPSGCGKSTTLRMIAGLETISGGELYIDGKLMNNVEPMHRDIAMVFQNYALYPHMTAYDNIAFGLKMRKIEEEVTDENGNKKVIFRHLTKEEIDSKVKEASTLLGIDELLYRKPSQMSGGQRQRIALGRALVRKPKVFLLDEPLSNLDAKLRTTMRSEIVKLHQKIKTTFIYVTHDQVEAMTMGTRIVVMKKGVVQQIDTPTNLFDYPNNLFVASFIGTPQMNIFNVNIKKNNNNLLVKFVNGQELSFDLNNLRKIEDSYLDGNEHNIFLGIRGEHLKFANSGLKVKANIVEVLGSSTHVFVKLEKENNDYIVCVNDRVDIVPHDELFLEFDEKKVHMFDKQSTLSIMKRWGE